MMSETGAVSQIIATAVGVAIRRPWITVLTVLSLTVGGLFYAAANLGINTDTADMISDSLSWRQDFITYRESFPVRDRNIVAVVDGPNGEISTSYARELAEALAEEPALFPTVFMAGTGDFFEQNGLLFLPLQELEQLADRLFDAQPLLGRLSNDVSGAGLLSVLGQSTEESAQMSANATEDLDSIFRELATTLVASRENERRQLAWGALIGTDGQAEARQLVLIRPTLDFLLIRPARAPIERLREIGNELNESYGNRVTLRLTGSLAMEHEELSSITRSASTAGLAALAMVVVVLFLALRSPVLLIIAVVVLLSGLSLTAAFAAATVGTLNLLSVAFAVLYIGLGVDFILHMSLRLKELINKGLELNDALIETSRGVGSSLLICAVTTAAGFFAFIPTEFDGVSELGLISGAGMIISFFVCLSLLPALIKLMTRGGASLRSTGAQPAGRTARELPARLIAGIAAVISVLALMLVSDLDFDGNPIHLRDPDAESIQALNDLAADSEAPLFSLAVLVDNAAQAEATAEALALLPTVQRVQTALSLVPSAQAEKLFEIEDLAFALGSTLEGFEAGPVNSARLIAELARLTDRLDEIDAPSEAQRALQMAIEEWLDAWRAIGDEQRDVLAETLEVDLLGDLVDQVSRLARGLNAQAFDRNDLPSELLSRWVNAAGQELVEVVPREDLNNNEAAARFVRDVRTVAPNATGLPVVYEEAAATVTRAFSIALAYAFGIVSLLLLLFLRSIRDALFVLVPIVFAAVVTAACSVLFGLPLNFANIIALPLLVGVGVDSGIHMVHRMRTEPPSDGDPLRTSTSRAVFLSALTTVASFGNLAFSTHPGMASMGQLLTIGMVMSLIAVLGLLPALMRLWRPV